MESTEIGRSFWTYSSIYAIDTTMQVLESLRLDDTRCPHYAVGSVHVYLLGGDTVTE